MTTEPGVPAGPFPWERHPEDTHKQWEAFTRYRDMGPDRSLEKVARELGKSGQLLSRWSVARSWVERVAAWDAHLDEQYRTQVIAERHLIAKKHARIARQFQAKLLRRMETLRPEELSAAEVRQWAELSLKIERGLYGMDDEDDADRVGPIQIVLDPRVVPGPTATPEQVAPLRAVTGG